MNAYSITVQQIGGWSITQTAGTTPPDTATLVLTDPLVHTWSFTDEVHPAPMEPATVQVSLVARTKDDLPPLRTGDMYRVTVELGNLDDDVWTSHGVKVVDFHGRLGDPEVELVPQARWKVRASLVFTDALADLRSRRPQPGMLLPAIDSAWRNNMHGWAGWHARDLNIWFPNEWNNSGDDGLIVVAMDGYPDGDPHEFLTNMAWSYPVGSQLAVLRTRYSTTGPGASYTAAGAVSVLGAPPPVSLPDLSNPVGYIFQFLNDLPAAAVLPYRLGPLVSGQVTLATDYDPADSVGLAMVPAGAVTIPATATRSRSQSPNTAIINGNGLQIETADNWPSIETTMEFTTNAAAQRSRSYQTYLSMRLNDPNGLAPEILTSAFSRRLNELPARLREAYQPDEAATGAEWAYESLIVDHQLLDPDAFKTLVPMFTSWGPGEFDGVARRPVSILDVAPDVDLSGRQTINGVLVGAEFRLESGEGQHTLKLAPGTLPPTPGATNAITATQLAAGPDGTRPATAFANLTALDMRLVRA